MSARRRYKRTAGSDCSRLVADPAVERNCSCYTRKSAVDSAGSAAVVALAGRLRVRG